MPTLIDFHSHTTRCCHAIGTKEAYIERAIALGLRDFGISDHSHWMLHAKGQRYAMRPDEQDDYVADVRRLQERYNSYLALSARIVDAAQRGQLAKATEMVSGLEFRNLVSAQFDAVEELRAAVRKERAEAAKQKNQVERLTAVNTELHEEARLVKRLPANEALAKTKKEAVGLQNETVGLVRGGLRQALLKLGEMGGDASHTAFMASLLGAVYVELDALRDEFGLPLATVDTTPEWERWAKAQGASAAAAAAN